MMLTKRKFNTTLTTVCAILAGATVITMSLSYIKQQQDKISAFEAELLATVTEENITWENTEPLIQQKRQKGAEVFPLHEKNIAEHISSAITVTKVDSNESENIVASLTGISDVFSLNENTIGYRVPSGERTELRVRMINTSEEHTIIQPTDVPYDIAAWTPVTDNLLVFQENVTQFVFTYDTATQISTLLGRFDSIGGSAGQGQVWFDDTDSSGNITIYDTNLRTSVIANLPQREKRIVTQILQISNSQKLWRFTGVGETSSENTQEVLLQTAAGQFLPVFSTKQKDEQFTEPMSFSKDGEFLAIPIKKIESDKSYVEIIALNDRTTITSFIAENVWFIK